MQSIPFDNAVQLIIQTLQSLQTSGGTIGGATAANQVTGNNSLTTLVNNLTSKIARIQGSANYSRVITGNSTTPANPIMIVHTGTTLLGVETISETITYTDPTVINPVITSIVYS